MKITRGSYIVKRNYTTFGGVNLPVVKVETAVECTGKKGGLTGKLKINGISMIDASSVRIITEEEATRIMGIWEDSKNISEINNDELSGKCKRDDNGNPKATYVGDHGWRTPLFVFRMKNPEGGFQAYKCPECGEVHIGKSFQESNVEKLSLGELLESASTGDICKAVDNYLEWETTKEPEPWLIYDDLTTKISREYRFLIEGDSEIAWINSYKMIAMEVAKRTINAIKANFGVKF